MAWYDFNCKTCTEPIVGNDIHCSTCKYNFHILCEEISYENIPALASAECPYTCNDCLENIIGVQYKFGRALARISKVSKIQRCGYPYLKAYLHQESKFILPRSFDICRDPVDDLKEHTISAQILKSCSMDNEGTPYNVTARGNAGSCLFNAVSVYLTGDQSIASELRVRTCVEMVKHEQFYQSHEKAPYFEIVSPTYQQAALDCGFHRGWSSMWTIMALSSVIGITMKSVYPPVNGKQDRSYQYLNTLVTPRESNSLLIKEIIKIMWTHDSEWKKAGIWTPNHFVPILAAKTAEVEESDNGTSGPHKDGSSNDDTTMVILSEDEDEGYEKLLLDIKSDERSKTNNFAVNQPKFADVDSASGNDMDVQDSSESKTDNFAVNQPKFADVQHTGVGDTGAAHTSSSTISDRDIHNLTAERLITVILNPDKYLKNAPLKGVRNDCIYTIQNASLNSIKCDDNGAYTAKGTNKKVYHVIKSQNVVECTKIVHKHPGNNRYYYKERQGREYRDVYVPTDEVYMLERTFRKKYSRFKTLDCETEVRS